MKPHYTNPERSWPTAHPKAVELRARIKAWSARCGLLPYDLFLAAGYSNPYSFIGGDFGISWRAASAVSDIMKRYPDGWERLYPPAEFKQLCVVMARRRAGPETPRRNESEWIEEQRRSREQERRAHEQYWLNAEKPPLGGQPKRSRPLSQMIA